jgi:hypothetical protein
VDLHPAEKQRGCKGVHPRAFAATFKHKWGSVSTLSYIYGVVLNFCAFGIAGATEQFTVVPYSWY